MSNETSEMTKGPWCWYQFGNHWALVTQHSGMLVVLDVVRQGMSGATFRVRDQERCLMIPFAPDHPDAKAIAAVPDLIEACQTFHEWLKREEDGLPKGIVRDTPQGEAAWRQWYDSNFALCGLAQERARAALKKAGVL